MSAREVELTGGAPWGFRMHGGADQNQPLRISRRDSNSLERSLDVNPGRKASLSGIREGDVISSINGRPTKGMCNSDAQAMLRSAGPVLRLGLNEDREMSPRRRSIGKGNELKRPSQLIAEVQATKATPQAPVYATIRPSQSPQNRPHLRSLLNSLPSALSSTPLVKSVGTAEEPIKFHPTNPFYTTLPFNNSSASKLPVPNGRASLSGLDRSRSVNKSKDESSFSDYSSDLRSPSYFSKTNYSGPSSLPHAQYNAPGQTNGYDFGMKFNAGDKSDPFSYDNKIYQNNSQGLPNESRNNLKNPFETGEINDPFEKYLRPDKLNGKCEYASKTISNSLSDSNFRSNEEITKRSTITEHKISEVEEVKTIKKIILNGSGDSTDNQSNHDFKLSSPTHVTPRNDQNFSSQQAETTKEEGFRNPVLLSTRNNPIFTTSTQHTNHYYCPSFDQTCHANSTNRSPREEYNSKTPTAEAPSIEVVSIKPPVTSPTTAPVHTPSPTTKREYITYYLLITTVEIYSIQQPYTRGL